ncbi:MAG: 5'-methylthioadenosine/S-adenosylhomocysteine nucleosidase [Eubacteriaceae bacterium]|nr:5'-methylthioadenosine/S-adenosylhomocysteine nucleosidase [Eubacteriaceae bacterium]
MIIVSASMWQEISEELTGGMVFTRSEKVACFEFTHYTLNGEQIAIGITGTGKASAAAFAQCAIMSFSPRLVLNIGTAGSAQESIKSKEIIIGTETVQHDFDISAFGYERGELPELNMAALPCDIEFVQLACKHAFGFNFHSGRMMTGDIIVDGSVVRERNLDYFEALSADMESAAIGQICTMHNVPYAVIRGISDEGNDDRHSQFAENIGSVADLNGRLAYRVLEEYTTKR